MANVYSTRLYKGDSLAAGSFSTVGIPAGFVYVVRDMRATCQPTTTFYRGTGLNGVKIETSTGGIIWRTPQTTCIAGYTYAGEGRYVMSAGEQLVIVTGEAGWSVYISGFQLTLP